MISIDMLEGLVASEQKTMIRVRVEDTGIGIAKANLDSIFDLFSQGDGSATRKYGGTGLGLTISRQLSNLMGGTIGVESELGRGSTFWFTMQMQKVDKPGRFEPSHHVLHGKRVLVVDDIEANRALLLDSLEKAQMQVVTVDSGKAALRELRYALEQGKPYDLALVDYLMPEMDGETLIRSVRNDPNIQAMPLIVLSSAEERGFIKTFSSMQVAAYIAKPVRRNQLLDMIAMVLEAKARGYKYDMFTIHSTEALRAKAVFTGEAPLRGVRVLLTEDNRINREFTTELLEVMGCTVDHAENGKIAIEKCLAAHYDIVLMDCQMPVMDGFEAAQTLQAMKTRGELPDFPVIALTANAMDGDRERCLRAGMHDYLSKPVRRAQMEAMLLRWLQNIQPLTIADTLVLPPPSPAAMQSMPVPEGVDVEALRETRSMVGSRMETILEYFLEDSEKYMQGIERCLSEHAPLTQATSPSHTLKSSARQFGLSRVSDLAQKIEEISRTSSDDAQGRAAIAQLMPALRASFEAILPFLLMQKTA